MQKVYDCVSKYKQNIYKRLVVLQLQTVAGAGQYIHLSCLDVLQMFLNACVYFLEMPRN